MHATRQLPCVETRLDTYKLACSSVGKVRAFRPYKVHALALLCCACVYTHRVDFLTHDISWHVPHHVSSKIPWYNLRMATNSLRDNWGDYMTECTFNWRMMKNIFTECHVYDENSNYKPFDFQKENAFLAVQRRWLPNGM